MQKNQTAVILLNWQGAEDTIYCIKSLLDSGVNEVDIIIVDNHSRDNSVEKIQCAYPRIHIILSSRNGGFAYGCNLGIRDSLANNYDYVWLLNNDTFVNCLTLPSLVDHARKHCLSIVGSILRDASFPWQIQAFGGGKVNFFTGLTQHIMKSEELVDLDYVSGASMLIDLNMVKEIGLLDEDFFMYFEDVEFCLRATRKNYAIGVSEKSIVYHKEGVSSNKLSYRQTAMIMESARKLYRKTTKFSFLPIYVNQLGKTLKSVARGDIGRIYYLWK